MVAPTGTPARSAADLAAFTLMSEAPIGWPNDVVFLRRQAKIVTDLRTCKQTPYNSVTLQYLDDGTQTDIVPCEQVRRSVQIRGFQDKKIPLRPIETAEHLEASKLDCVICFDSFAPADGISCHADADKHFLCNECFEAHVKTESETEAMDLLAQREGCVFCPGCEETPAFSDAEVARHCNDAVFVIYTDAKKKLVEARLAEQIGAEERARMDAELERLQKMTDEEREVEKERRHIEDIFEDMLYLKCPRCKMVFVDFTNCAALTCGKVGCGCGFCAWCQEDCGDDAHQHVANCPVKPRGEDTVYDTKDEFMLVQRRRQRAAITAYLRDDVKRDIQPRVAEACRVVLTGAEMGDICDQYSRAAHQQPVAARGRDPDEDDFMLAQRLQMEELEEADGDANPLAAGLRGALPWAGNARRDRVHGGAARAAYGGGAAVNPLADDGLAGREQGVRGLHGAYGGGVPARGAYDDDARARRPPWHRV
eukprot:COSAG01_NODE_10539_length_2136_cov_3.113402_2_plen_481_part_00